jgi:hypothetical protein
MHEWIHLHRKEMVLVTCRVRCIIANKFHRIASMILNAYAKRVTMVVTVRS